MGILKSVFLGYFLIFSASAVAQATRSVTGSVQSVHENGKNEYVEGATVSAPGTGIGTKTDKTGKFQLLVPDSLRMLIVSYIGYLPDTTFLEKGEQVLSITLRTHHTLKEIVIRDKRKTTELSLIGPMLIEKISGQELLKAACCNLSESFETTPSVDVAFTDAVTGYKQVKLLGLSGPYTQITRENIPDVRGLAAITGLTFTPGAWIESMQLSKGTGSVVNGFESVAGQINVELLKPFSGERWRFSLYQSGQGRSEANITFKQLSKKNVGTNLMVYAHNQWLKTDQNQDHFLDQPLGNQIALLNRWIFSDPKGWMFQAGVKFVYVKGMGGDWNYRKGDSQIAGHAWGYENETQRLEGWAKVAKSFPKRTATSVGLQLSATSHEQNSKFGAGVYRGTQNSAYANLIFQTYINNTNHIVKTGVSGIIDKYTERYAQKDYTRNEQVPGVFCEYAYNYLDKFNLVAGLRADNNNLYGPFVTPRLHARYAILKRTTLRASVGRAQRTANIFAENAGFMASSRQFMVEQNTAGKAYGLDPEVAWNMGGNLVHKFRIGLREAALSVDYYYTEFQKQVVVDQEALGILRFYNLNGRSDAHGISTQFDYEILHNLNVKAAYRYYRVMITYDGQQKEKPLTPAHRAFVNVDYTTRNKWKFDYTVQLIGSQRTPGIIHTQTGIWGGGDSNSPAYVLMNGQITKVVSGTFDIYVGAENLTNYMQHHAIIAANEPFGKWFDASVIWAPMMGRTIYFGIRYKIK